MKTTQRNILGHEVCVRNNMASIILHYKYNDKIIGTNETFTFRSEEELIEKCAGAIARNANYKPVNLSERMARLEKKYCL